MSLAFLSKKSWHTANLRNVEKVWLAEQKHAAEEKKVAELRKNIEEERQLQELRQLQAARGDKSAAVERLDWMYEGPSAGREKTAEEFLLGKEYKGEDEKAAKGDVDLSNTTKYGSLALTKSALPANDAFQRLNEDPMMLIRKRQQAAREQVLKNPVKMKRIKDEVDRLQEDKKARKKAKKAAKKERKLERREEKRQLKKRKRGDDRSDDSDTSGEEARSRIDRSQSRRSLSPVDRADRRRSRSSGRRRERSPSRREGTRREESSRRPNSSRERDSQRRRSPSRREGTRREKSSRHRNSPRDRERERSPSRREREESSRRHNSSRERDSQRRRSPSRREGTRREESSRHRNSPQERSKDSVDEHRGDQRRKELESRRKPLDTEGKYGLISKAGAVESKEVDKTSLGPNAKYLAKAREAKRLEEEDRRRKLGKTSRRETRELTDEEKKCMAQQMVEDAKQRDEYIAKRATLKKDELDKHEQEATNSNPEFLRKLHSEAYLDGESNMSDRLRRNAHYIQRKADASNFLSK